MQQQTGQDDVQALVAKVSRHVLLPEGEIPTVMTVTDKEKNTSKQFFANAKNGDKVLVYMMAKKAFLYDVALDRILEIGPVLTSSSGSAQMVGAVTSTPNPQAAGLRFVLYNGTTMEGLTRGFVPVVKEKIAGATVVGTAMAAKHDYATSVLIDVSGTRSGDASAYATLLGLTVSPLPAGEHATASADFLVILGSDKK